MSEDSKTRVPLISMQNRELKSSHLTLKSIKARKPKSKDNKSSKSNEDSANSEFVKCLQKALKEALNENEEVLLFT